MIDVLQWFKSLESKEERSYIASISDEADVLFILQGLTTCCSSSSSSSRKQPYCFKDDNNNDTDAQPLEEDLVLPTSKNNFMKKKVVGEDDDNNNNHGNNNNDTSSTTTHPRKENDVAHEFLSNLILIPSSDAVLLSYYDGNSNNDNNVDTFLHIVNNIISLYLSTKEVNTNANTAFLTPDPALATSCNEDYPPWYQPQHNSNTNNKNTNSMNNDEIQLASFIVAQMEVSIRKAYLQFNHHHSNSSKIIIREPWVNFTSTPAGSPLSPLPEHHDDKTNHSINNKATATTIATTVNDLCFVIFQPQTHLLPLFNWFRDTMGYTTTTTNTTTTTTTSTSTMFQGLCIVLQPFFVNMVIACRKKEKKSPGSDETVTYNKIIKFLLLQYHSAVKEILQQQRNNNANYISKNNNSKIKNDGNNSNASGGGGVIHKVEKYEGNGRETVLKKKYHHHQQQQQQHVIKAGNTTKKTAMGCNNNNNNNNSMVSIIEKSIEETIASIEASTNTSSIIDRSSSTKKAADTAATKSKSSKKKRRKNKTNKGSCYEPQLPDHNNQDHAKKINPSTVTTKIYTSSDTNDTERQPQKVSASLSSTAEEVKLSSSKKQQSSQGNQIVVNSSAAANNAELTSQSSSSTTTATASVVVTLLDPPIEKDEDEDEEEKIAKISRPQLDSASHKETSLVVSAAVSDSDSWEVVERKIRNKRPTAKASQQQVHNHHQTTNSSSITSKHHIHHRRQRSAGSAAVSATNADADGNNNKSTNNRSSRRKSTSRQISRFARDVVSQIISTVIDEQQYKTKNRKSSNKMNEVAALKRREQEIYATIKAARKIITSYPQQKHSDTTPAPTFVATALKDIKTIEVVTSKNSKANAEAAAAAAAEVTTPTMKSTKHESTFMPIPTYLGVHCSNNSASSSVSSSLDTPNINGILYTCGKSSSTLSEARLIEGYHLLDVCDRLSAEISIFMKRRAAALEIRRLQIQHLMKVMHNTVSSIWDGEGVRVEVMGSCATSLDLPSSDLDLVVCGIKNYSHLDDPSEPFPYYNHPNAPFVMRLAMELEKKPWAVQTKPIPTASVPVVKILVDPSRLLSNTGAIDFVSYSDELGENGAVAKWNLEQTETHLGYDSTTEMQKAYPVSSSVDSLKRQGDVFGLEAPWRGAGLPNGFLSVDITFEGHGHGGIGSTTYAATVVREACDEFKCPPDDTPTVQLIMVIKELLAQRRLNEPFSGGLSSYSVLLMVCAAIREAKAVREELGAAAKQQRCEVSEVLSDGASKNKLSKSCTDVCNVPGQELLVHNSIDKMSNKIGSKSSSWAVIAKNAGSGCCSVNMDLKPTSSCSAAGIAQLSPTAKFTTTFGDKTVSSKRLSKSEPTLSTEMSTTVCPTVTLTVCSEEVPVLQNSIVSEESLRLLTKIRSSILFQGAGTDDILEVLCSGEPTAGKLLMYFLLFYGKLFNAQTTVVDMNALCCPFVPRQAGGSIDPITGVFTVDPIVVYDPLEGEEGHNVARSCFAWYSIRQVFSQCYATLTQSLEGRGHHRNLERDEGSPILALILSY